MTRKQWAFALLALAAMAVGTWWIRQRPPQAPGVPADVGAPSRIAPDPSDVPASATPATPPPPMPLVGIPLRDSLPSLRERADAGDGKAACRLAMELLRCREVGRLTPERERWMEEQLQALPAGSADERVESMARTLSLHRGVRAACAGLPAGLEDQAGRYLRTAALAGEPEALIRYAAGEGFDNRAGYGYILTPEFDQWRREARGLMDRALVGGDPRAAVFLYGAHSNDTGLFAGLTAGEASETYAYAALIRNLYGESLAPLASFLDFPTPPAEQAGPAAARAAAWHQDYFDGRQFDLIDMALDAELLPEHATADEVLARELCPGPETQDHD